MRLQTITLLLLLGETFAGATSAIEKASSRSWYTYSGHFMQPRKSRSERSCWSPRIAAHLLPKISSPRISAESGSEELFACAFSSSLSTPVAKSTCLSKLQQQQQQVLHTVIYSTFLTSCLGSASLQQRRRRPPSFTCTPTEGAATHVITLPRSSSLMLLRQEKGLQGKFLLLLSCPVLLQQHAASCCACSTRGSIGATAAAAAAVVTSGHTSLPAATLRPEAPRAGSIAEKRKRRTAPQRHGDAPGSITRINFGGTTSSATTSYSALNKRDAVNLKLQQEHETKNQLPLAHQLLKQQKDHTISLPTSSALTRLPFAALASTRRVAASGSGLYQMFGDCLSFVCTTQPPGFTCERYSSSVTRWGSSDLLFASSKGVCGRNTVPCTIVGNWIFEACQCRRVTRKSRTGCRVARDSSRILNDKACHNRSSKANRIPVDGSNVDSRCCSSESGGGFVPYVCLTSPEAARVFSSCWRRAGCPALLPGMLVCIGESTRAAAEQALLLDFQLYAREQEHSLQCQRLHHLLQTHKEQQQGDQQNQPHVLSEEKREKADQAQHHPCIKENALHYSPLMNGNYAAGHYAGRPVLPTSSTVSPSSACASAAAGACSHPAAVRLSDPASCAHPTSTADPVSIETRSPAEAAAANAHPAVDEEVYTCDIAADVDARLAEEAAANDAHTEADWLAGGGAERAATAAKQCGHKATTAARPDMREEVNDSAALRIQRSFLSFKPSSSSAASLAVQLPPRPPLLQHLQAAVYALLGQQGAGQQQLGQTVVEESDEFDDIERTVDCVNAAIICRSKHAHPGCTYTPEDAVSCTVKLLYQGGRELKTIMLQWCCPCWLQTCILWPASALARPTLQDLLEQRPLQHLQQYVFTAVPSTVRLQFDVLPLQRTAETNVNEDEATEIHGDLRVQEASKPAAVTPSVATITETLQGQRKPCTAASTPAAKASGLAVGEVMLRKSAGPPPAEDTEIPAANRLFEVERYNTYTTTQVMLTSAERNAVLQRMREVLCCRKGRSRTDSSGGLTCTKRHRSKDGSFTTSPDTLNRNENSKKTSGTLDRSSPSVETTHRGGLKRDQPYDLPTILCDSTDYIVGNASGASTDRASRASSTPETKDGTQAGNSSDNSSADVRGSGGREESRQSSQDTAEPSLSKRTNKCEGLVIVVLASPSAVWGWTGNGLPVSAVACCTERPLPSYTAVHANIDGERRLHQRHLPHTLLHQSSSIDVGSDESSCSEVSGSSGNQITHKNSNSTRSARRINSSKVTVDSSTSNVDSRISGEDLDENDGKDTPTSGSKRISNRTTLNPADLQVGGTASRTRGRLERDRRDAAVHETEEFVRLLQNCQRVIQEGRRQREQEQQDGKRRRLVALCIGPTTASAAKQAGFCETLTGEPGSVAALADLVETCVMECCHRHFDPSEKRCSNKHDRANCNNNGQDQTNKINSGIQGSSSSCCCCSTPNGISREPDLERRSQKFSTRTKANAAGEDEWSSKGTPSDGNGTMDERESGRSEAETCNGSTKQESTEEQDIPAIENQPGAMREKKMQILVVLTRADGRNDTLVQELLKRKELSIRTVGLKHLVSKPTQRYICQRLRNNHQHFQVPGKEEKKQSRSGTPVGVLEVPLLHTQVTHGIFIREQRRLIAALVHLQPNQGDH